MLSLYQKCEVWVCVQGPKLGRKAGVQGASEAARAELGPSKAESDLSDAELGPSDVCVVGSK